MAFRTLQRLWRFVFAEQREFGLLVVIEDVFFPILFVVAVFALGTEFPFVSLVIILLVTRSAQHRCVFVLIVDMAFCALHFIVLAQ